MDTTALIVIVRHYCNILILITIIISGASGAGIWRYLTFIAAISWFIGHG